MRPLSSCSSPSASGHLAQPNLQHPPTTAMARSSGQLEPRHICIYRLPATFQHHPPSPRCPQCPIMPTHLLCLLNVQNMQFMCRACNVTSCGAVGLSCAVSVSASVSELPYLLLMRCCQDRDKDRDNDQAVRPYCPVYKLKGVTQHVCSMYAHPPPNAHCYPPCCRPLLAHVLLEA